MLSFLNTATKYILSFLRADWRLEDYPLRVSVTRASPRVPGLEVAGPWTVQIVNWWQMAGYGTTRHEAYEDLRHKLEERRASGVPLPRPGTKVTMQFASMVEIKQYKSMAREFLNRICRVDIEDCLLTDESSLLDFATGFACASEEPISPRKIYEMICGKVREAYGVDVMALPDDRLVTIFRAILKDRGFA